MKVNLSVNPHAEEETIDICVRSITPKIEKMLSMLNEQENLNIVPVVQGDRSYLLTLDAISHVYVNNSKCLVVSNAETFAFKGTLKQFEEMYANHHFVRLSKYCVANLQWIHYFEASFSGGIVVFFKNGMKEHVSRQYAKQLRDKLTKE